MPPPPVDWIQSRQRAKPCSRKQPIEPTEASTTHTRNIYPRRAAATALASELERLVALGTKPCGHPHIPCTLPPHSEPGPAGKPGVLRLGFLVEMRDLWSGNCGIHDHEIQPPPAPADKCFSASPTEHSSRGNSSQQLSWHTCTTHETHESHQPHHPCPVFRKVRTPERAGYAGSGRPLCCCRFDQNIKTRRIRALAC